MQIAAPQTANALHATADKLHASSELLAGASNTLASLTADQAPSRALGQDLRTAGDMIEEALPSLEAALGSADEISLGSASPALGGAVVTGAQLVASVKDAMDGARQLAVAMHGAVAGDTSTAVPDTARWAKDVADASFAVSMHAIGVGTAG